jgi:DNA-binding transcriptional ArsR family regulator
MNIKEQQPIKQISDLLREISAPSRMRIILAIGKEEVCVCHLEATLGMRQAYLSQHLMALRKAGVLITNRDGRFINYRLAEPKILDLIYMAAGILNEPGKDLLSKEFKQHECRCPRCSQLHGMAIN